MTASSRQSSAKPADVSPLEQKVDRLVCVLYGLTRDEIKVVGETQEQVAYKKQPLRQSPCISQQNYDKALEAILKAACERACSGFT